MAIVVSEVNTRVRFLMGNVSTTVLPDATLDQIIQNCIDEIGSEDTFLCEVTYCALLDSLRHLQRVAEANAGENSTEISKRKEKNGKREIQVEFGTSNSVGTSGWQSMYDHYLQNPQEVCKELVGEDPMSLVHIGGVEKDEYSRVTGDINSRNAYQLSVNKKYTRSTSRNIRRRRSSFLN